MQISTKKVIYLDQEGLDYKKVIDNYSKIVRGMVNFIKPIEIVSPLDYGSRVKELFREKNRLEERVDQHRYVIIDGCHGLYHLDGAITAITKVFEKITELADSGHLYLISGLNRLVAASLANTTLTAEISEESAAEFESRLGIRIINENGKKDYPLTVDQLTLKLIDEGMFDHSRIISRNSKVYRERKEMPEFEFRSR